MRKEKSKSGSGRRIVLTGGGTGGHVYPALAIAEAVRAREPDTRFAYVGIARGAEAEIVPKYPHLVGDGDLRFVDVVGMPDRTVSPRLIGFLARLARGTIQAHRILRELRPDAVIGTGGYVSAPAVIAARLRGVPVLLNEQNAVPGKVTRLLGRLAQAVTVAFEKTLTWFPNNGVHVGYPVRGAVRSATATDRTAARAEITAELGVESDRAIVLVTGGSLGARSINRAMVETVRQIAERSALRRRLLIVHGVGRCETPEYHAWEDTITWLGEAGVEPSAVRDFYRPVRYLFDIERYYAAADVICCRGGAGSIAEAAAFGRPTLVIPKSGLPGEHQVENARALDERGGCLVLGEVRDDASHRWVVRSDEFLSRIEQLLNLPDEQAAEMGDRFRAMDRPDCLDRILSALDAFRLR